MRIACFIKDIQGNIIGIVDGSNSLIASYVYDAWGNFTVFDGTGKVLGTSETIYSSTTAIWNLNPFRYRGYYYDIETGLYYLLNRYYDPQTGRFLSLDNSSYADPETINGLNLYLYCNNNPVMYVDPTGHFILSTFLLGLGISMLTWGIVNTAVQLGSDLFNLAFTGDWESGWEDYLGAFLGGLAGGATFYLSGGNLAATFAIMGGAETLFTSYFTNVSGRTNYSDFEMLGKTLFSMGIGFVSGKFLKGTKIPGITKGSNSFLSVWKSGLTKLFNGTALRMSSAVMIKGLVSIATLKSGSVLLNGLLGSVVEWFYEFFC